jgi:hypothetical protein
MVLPLDPKSSASASSATPAYSESRRAKMVGKVGFEPTTPCSQSRCASQAALLPAPNFKSGVSDGA